SREGTTLQMHCMRVVRLSELRNCSLRIDRGYRGRTSLCSELHVFRWSVAFSAKPSRKLLGHGPSGSKQVLAGHDLPDHEIAEELAHVGQNVLRPEGLAELAMLSALEAI